LGIPKDTLRNVFMKEGKISCPATAGEPGTGFGLPVVSHFLRLYGGRIDIASRSIEEYR
jgi:signal transduction histidine kinase